MQLNIEPGRACAFLGYGPGSLPWGWDDADARAAAFRERLRKAIQRAWADGYRQFLTGLAPGSEAIYAGLLVGMRDEECRGMEVCGFLPSPELPKSWSWAQKVRYWERVEACDGIELLSWERGWCSAAERNRRLIAQASRLIAVWNGRQIGSVANGMRMAQGRGMLIHVMRLEACGEDEPA